MISTANEVKDWLNKIEESLNEYGKLDGYKDKNFLVNALKVEFCDEDDVDTYITVFVVENGESYSILLPQLYETITESQLGAYLYGSIMTELKYN